MSAETIIAKIVVTTPLGVFTEEVEINKDGMDGINQLLREARNGEPFEFSKKFEFLTFGPELLKNSAFRVSYRNKC